MVSKRCAAVEQANRLVAAGLLLASSLASADTYTCTSSSGKPFMRDRYIPECSDVTQTVRNADGSPKQSIPPSMSAIEVEAKKDADRRREIEIANQQELVRRDKILMTRFPDEAAHAKARADALDDTKKSIERSEKRLSELAAERKPLDSEAEFYVGRQMPLKLKQSLDANDAATAAQRSLIANQQADVARVNTSFDIELARLRRLWAGAPPGSLGTLATVASTPPARKPATR